MAWGDYDNDGDLDILLAGSTGSDSAISRIYRNDGGTFTDIEAGLPGVFSGSVAWGDYDNDGDLDLLLTTSGIGIGTSGLYRNDGGRLPSRGGLFLPARSLRGLGRLRQRRRSGYPPNWERRHSDLPQRRRDVHRHLCGPARRFLPAPWPGVITTTTAT